MAPIKKRFLFWPRSCAVLLAYTLTFSSIDSSKALRSSRTRQWGIQNAIRSVECQTKEGLYLSSSSQVLQILRAGAIDVDKNEQDEDEVNDDEQDEEVNDDEEDEEEDEEEEEEDDEDTVDSAQVQDSSLKTEYDTMLIPSPSIQLYSVVGVMLLSRRVDMFSPSVVRLGRFLFIAYIVALQLFLLYVRFQAKSINDRTPIVISSPISKMLETTKNDQVKTLASSLLSSQSTVLEYDLTQAKSMNGGLLVNMGFMWFLHFKMGQTQPLFMQTIQGITNLYYSPLFQIYVMGRNLERPFKNPTTSKLMAAATAETEEKGVTETAEAESTVDNNEEDDDEEDDDDDDDHVEHEKEEADENDNAEEESKGTKEEETNDDSDSEDDDDDDDDE